METVFEGFVYFRTAAREAGCPNTDDLGDLAVWYWLHKRINGTPEELYRQALKYFEIT